MSNAANLAVSRAEEEIASRLADATPEAAANLRELADAAPDKATRKSARRALYLLSQKGVVPPAKASASHDVVPTQNPKSKIQNSQRAWASAFDGAGNRLLLVLLPGTDSGSPTLAQILLNDETGVADWGGQRMTPREVEPKIAEYLAQLDQGLALAEIEPDYARFLVRHSRDRTRQMGRRTPAGFIEIANRIGEPEQTYAISPIYSRVHAEAIRADETISHDAADLFALSWLDAWFFPAEEAAPWTLAWSTSELLPDMERGERQAAIISEASPYLMNDASATLYARRLEESADILLRRNQSDAAHLALYHALTLRDDAPLVENSFARALVQRTIEAALALDREARLAALGRGQLPTFPGGPVPD